MDKSFEVTMTATSECLEFLKKEMNTFSSHKVEIEFDTCKLTKKLVVGDVISIGELTIKITIITDTMITGWTVNTKINGDK